MQLLHSSAFLVFVAILAAVSVLGFFGARWRRGDLDQLDESGLGGRQFGTLITWFLVGGDFYTAYTIIAVPALVFGTGAMGFFALPYTIIVYPFVFLAMPRLWAVARKHGYITPADFVQGRYGSRTLATLVALTGITATMPYIALQLAGMGAVLAQLGLTGNSWVQGAWTYAPISTESTCSNQTWGVDTASNLPNRIVVIDPNYNVTSVANTTGCVD